MSPANSINGAYNHRYTSSNDLATGYEGQDWLTLPLDPLLNVHSKLTEPLILDVVDIHRETQQGTQAYTGPALS